MTLESTKQTSKNSKTRFYDYSSTSSIQNKSNSKLIPKDNYSILKSFRNAFQGILIVLKNEPNSIFQIGIFVISSLLLLVKIDYWLLINFVLFVIVLGLEIMNSAIERLCDYVQDGFDTKIGNIKDISAASVLVASVGWGAVIVYKLITLYLI
jgi:diacylglycerol kinase